MLKYSLLVFLFILSTYAENYLVTVKVDVQDMEKVREYLEVKGFDISGYNKETQQFEIVTDSPRFLQHEQAVLNTKGLTFEIADITASEPYNNLVDQNRDASYFGPDETVEQLQQLEKQYPQWAKVYNVNEWLGLPPTVEGRAIYALQVSTNPGLVEDEPKIMIIGEHHARELMTHHAVLDSAADYLTSISSGDVSSLAAVENNSVWFVPMVNPDGLAYVFSSDRMWRKNRTANSGGSYGVDLNRNYAFKWGACGSHSSSGSSQVFKGPSAESEVEVKVMDRLNAKLQCQYIISYHSSGDEVLYPYRCGDMAEANIYNDVRDRLAKHIGFGKRLASSSGEDFEHHYAMYGSISFLLEIGSSFQPAFSTYRNSVWPNVQKVLPFMLQELNKPHIHIKIMSKDTGAPLAAELSVAEIQFKEQEVRRADQHGSYRWRLLPGNYNVTVKMKGYDDKKISIQAGGQKSNYFVELEQTK